MNFTDSLVRYAARTEGRMMSLEAPAAPRESLLRKVRLIVAAVSDSRSSVGVSEVSRATGLSKSTVHRLCGELVDWGILDQKGNRLQLGFHLFELGQRVPFTRTLRDVALPFMEDLFVATGETVHLGVQRSVEVVYVEKIVGHSPVAAPSKVGGRLPLYCTGVGKAILAFSPADLIKALLLEGLRPRTPFTIATPELLLAELEQIRQQGFAVEREESALGVVCAAAPIFGPEGDVVGAVSVTGSQKRDPQQLSPAVRTAAFGISRSLGAAAPGTPTSSAKRSGA